MKKFFSLLLVFAMVFSLAACGNQSNDSGDSGNNSTTTPAPSGGSDNTNIGDTDNTNTGDSVEITYWGMWNSGEPQAVVIEAAAAAYEAETGVHVNIEWKGRSINEIITASLEAKENIDIFDDDYERITKVYAPYTYDLTDMAAAADYASHSYPVLVNQTIEWAGYLNCMAEQPNMGGMFYDKDAFEAAGITDTPTTWAEFLNVCQKLKDNSVGPIALDSAYANLNMYYHLVRYLGEDGIAELRENGGWADNAKAVQAAQDMIDLVNAGFLAEGAPDEYPASQNKIGLGQAAMVVCADYVTAEVDNAIEPVNWGLFNYPAVEGGASTAGLLGCNAMAITSYSEHPQEAFDFIMFLTTGEWGQKLSDDASQIPADPNNTCNYMPGAVETLLAADAPMGWCTELNTHPAWNSMKDEFVKLFEGTYATGADFCAAIDALY